MISILQYTTESGRNPFELWFESLKDPRTQARIGARLDRAAAGNFGDCKKLEHGVSELRIDFGPGYRVYYAMVESSMVLLLCGGDKRRQASDINKAIEYLQDYLKRTAKP